MSRGLLGVSIGALGLAACAPSAPVATPAPAPAPAAVERPIPHPVEPSPEFQAAIAAGTRTETGAPGPNYWQNWADYRIRSRLFPEDNRLEASEVIRYHNRSPDVLQVLVLDLNQNFHREGAIRLEPAEVTGGIEFQRVAVGGAVVQEGGTEGSRYVVEGTKMVIVPPTPVRPGETVELTFDWAFDIPKAGIGERMGYDEDLFYLAYWYPTMAVYDDVIGWHPDPFLGTAEFYAGFGSYDVTMEVPTGWVVWGTGALQNTEEVLTERVQERLQLASVSDTTVHVLTPETFAGATQGESGEWLSWHFQADTARDVAYNISRNAFWDAARTPVGDRDGDGEVDYTLVGAFFREPAFRWKKIVPYMQQSIRFLSDYTGYAYPWPHMTAVEGEGIISSGMEYPMMTLIGDYTARGDSALYYVTAHELAHMWIPMIVGTDERRFSWIDEGFTTFSENQARADFFPGSDPEAGDRDSYIRVALRGMEGEMMRRSGYHYTPVAFGTASYSKPATILVALRSLLGEETFLRAYREFVDRWAFKHPQPWDLWNTFEDVSGRDLDWFWRSWYYETWTLDQAVEAVVPGPEGAEIVVRDIGDVPLPARLAITLESGEVLQREIPVETWLAGARTATVTVPAGAEVVRVEIDPEGVFPDVDRENNVWVR